MAETKILIVEDDAATAEFMKRAVQSLGYLVAANVASGEEAIRAAEEHQPALALMDIQLKGSMDGVEAAGRIRSKFDIPIVYLTALSDEETLERVRLTEPFGYVLKPVKLNELRGVIGMALYKHELDKKLRHSEQRYRGIVENLPVLICRFLEKDKVITFVNDSYCNYFKKSREELVGHSFLSLVPEFEHANIKQHFQTLNRDNPLATYEHRVYTPSGIRVQRWTNQALLDEHGDVIEYQSIGEDITEQRQAEEKLLDYNRELERRVEVRTHELQATVNELESFTYSVMHDLRAPLRHILGFGELLKQDAVAVLSEKSARYMNIIIDSTKRISILMDDLLAFTRMGRTEMNTNDVDLFRLIQDVKQELVQEIANRNIEWTVGELPLVQGDASMLRLVLSNLLTNAIKFTRPREQARIEIEYERSGGEHIFAVRDNGVGFEMEYADKLFKVFQRLHHADEFEGTGIGLANVKRIIQRHGGRVWARGVPGEGSSFYFTLPI